MSKLGTATMGFFGHSDYESPEAPSPARASPRTRDTRGDTLVYARVTRSHTIPHEPPVACMCWVLFCSLWVTIKEPNSRMFPASSREIDRF